MRSSLFFVSRIIPCLVGVTVLTSLWNIPGFGASAAEAPGKPGSSLPKNDYELRRSLYEEIGLLTQIPWHWLAAIDQYERSITPRSQQAEMNHRMIRIRFKEAVWAGPLNPNPNDINPATIALFGGIGKDASSDAKADPTNDRDALYTMAAYLLHFGYSDDDIRIALWRYYQNDSSVERIRQFAKIYKTFNRIDLSDNAFPLPVTSTYTYRDTWGDRRGWGGLRTHEGTDLFASYGVPVRSVCYGIVETKGWNPYGGWRIGIRDLNNRYHYYAHLQGFDKKINIGDTVSPGQMLGWVGSSGYGPPGTQGRFPPHLHYGIYKDTGTREWAFNPFPLLQQWEKSEKVKKQNNKGAS
ncbi:MULTISPECIES: M23 family metallopeptidase [Paenibacillus]|uniref:L-Ala--D-Glu endopeptidase n=1 Tax=Paenibacillus woosongensis TaxID=307580 RepID=A0ABQ4MVM7_9BACL|nr:M23 family metallopeptidase [Paenibacillus woosongensis]GIP59930.1 L-Ala--D-Glu endopeptidase [Paenibacillus woosongensis]